MSRGNYNIDANAFEGEEKRQPKSSFDEKNYLNVKLGPKEDSKQLVIRLLPVEKGTGNPFKIIHMHTIKVPEAISKSGWKSYVCLNKTDDIDHEHYGTACPFCEMAQDAWSHYREEKKLMEEAQKNHDEEQKNYHEGEMNRWKEIAKANTESEVCILRVIERGAEADGPKFWKFNVRTDGKDPMHFIKDLYALRKKESIDEAKMDNGGVLPDDFEPTNILDLYEGKDLQITVSAVYDKEGKRTKKTSISVMDYGRFKPLSQDESQIDAWCEDEKVWSDVFVVKPYEYLSIVLDGEVPYYDKANNKWVTRGRYRNEDVKEGIKQEREAEKEIEVSKKSAVEAAKSVSAGTEDVGEPEPDPVEEESEEGLPF